MTIFRRMLLVFGLCAILLNGAGCTTAVIAGAAAAGGYIAHENGYRVRNPITHSSSQADSSDGGK